MQTSWSASHSVYNPFHRLSRAAIDLLIIAVFAVFAIVAIYGLLTRNMYLCLETVFVAFIPYVIWSAHRRVGVLDVFAPDVGFPLVYVAYLFLGSLNLRIPTEFSLTLPWVVWLYYIIGLVAYLSGVRLFRKPTPALAAAGVVKTPWQADRFLLLSTLLLIVGLGVGSIPWIQSGIPIFHANDEGARLVGTGGVIGGLALCSEAAFECLLIYLIAFRPKGFVRWFVLGSMCLIALHEILGSNRTGLLRPAITGVIIYHYAARRLNLKSLIVVGLLAGIFASVLGTFRDVSEWGEARERTLEQLGLGPSTYWLMNGYEALRIPAEGFDMTIEAVPLISPYTYGSTSLATLLQVLPGHHPSPSQIVKDTLRLHFIGFGAAATILAPLWFDGGIVGIIVGMFLFGLVARSLYIRALLSRNYVWLLLYAWFVQNAFKAIKDDILPDLSVIVVAVLFLLFAMMAGPLRREQSFSTP